MTEGAARLTRGLALMLLALWLAALSAPQALAQARGTVSAIDVTGNQRIEAATVISYLALGVGDPITDAAVNDSVRRLFDTGLFRDAAVQVEGSRLVVRVAENPTINRIAFEGNDAVTDEQLLPNISSRPRRAFTRSRAEADAAILVEIYRRVGRFAAEVEPVVIELPDNRVDLVFEITEGSVTGVNAINFIGNETFSDRRLRSVIDTTETGLLGFLLTSDIYDPDRLEFDRELLRRFYLSRGFADFQVISAVAELSPDREGFFITFTVEEGPQFTFGEQSVTSTAIGLDPTSFQELIEGAPGDIYNADIVERNIDRMVFLAGQQGFAFVEVRPRAVRDPENLTLGIVYELVEGPRVFVERIDIEGNTRTLDRVIRRQFDIVEGDAFNSRAVEQARTRIRGLGFFNRVDVATERGAAEDRANIKVSVDERATGSLTFGVGFSSAEGILGEISLTERNLLGRGQFLRTRVLVAGDQQTIDLTFREPALLDRDLEAGFRAFYRQEDRTDQSSFEETNFGLVPEIEFPVSEFGRLSLNYQIASDEIRDVRPDASRFILEDEGTQFTSAVGYGYTYDRRNDPLEPTQGYLLRFGQDFAGVGGDAQYVRTTARARGYTSFFDEDVVLSLDLEGGHMFAWGEDLRITDRFQLGGDRFRGFERGGIGPRDLQSPRQDALGGEIFAVARTDLSFPIGLPEDLGIFGGVFADVGTLFQLEENSIVADSFTTPTTQQTFTVDDDPKLRASVGVSLFWDSGFGPLRVNFALPVVEEDGDETEAFRLTAGTRF
jgi:outer membrane protein insertion porin family